MGFIFGCLFTLLGVGIGCYCDATNIVVDPACFWAMGCLTGMGAAVVTIVFTR